MQKDQKLIEQRNKFIKETVNKSESVSKAVKQLERTIFVSERTIYRVIKQS